MPNLYLEGVNHAGLSEWSDSHRHADDGAVESEQHAYARRAVVEATASGAERLGTVYWSEVERSTARLVRQHRSQGGLELRLAGVGPALLRFGQPRFTGDGTTASATYPIAGGLLARRAAGSISFRQVLAERAELASEIQGFYPVLAARLGAPAWTGELYRQVQARLHSYISRRYFRRLVRESNR